MTDVKPKLNVNNDEDVVRIKKGLINYIRIEERHYHLIPSLARVRYINRETGDFSYGGIIIKNEAPEKITLKGNGYNRKWTLVPSNIMIFVEDHNYRSNLLNEKNNVYKLFKEGKLKLSMDDV
jgi:hypothetical protein